jgi:hypothetical protein
MRTGLGRLGVQPHIAELCINHVKGGVEAIYDRHKYQHEIGEALARWAAHVLDIVEGRPSKVVALRAQFAAQTPTRLSTGNCRKLVTGLISPRAGGVSWMARIERPAVKADIRAIAARLDVLFGPVVARFAERLKWSEPERVDVAAVRLDVVADLRRRNATALETILAERVREQLVPPDPAPAGGAVPG